MRAIADQQRQEAELQRLEAERHAARSTMMLLLGSALNRGRLSPADLRAVALATNIATAINDTQSVEPQLLGLLRGLQEEKVWMLEELRPQGLADQMTALAWSPSSSDPLLAGGFDDGTLAVWPDALGGGTNAPLVLRGGHTNRVTSVAWGGDSRAIALPLLASAARDGRLLVWEPTGGGGYLPRPLGSDEQRHGDVMSVAWSPIRASVPPLLAASARDGNVTIWLWQGEPPPSVPLWTLPRRLDGDNSTPTKPAGAVAFSPDGSLLVCGFDSGSILVWELPEALGDTLPIHRLVGSHNYRVTSLAFRPGPRNGPFVLASASAGGFPFNRTAVPEVRLWSVAGSGTPELLTVIPTAFQRPVASLAWLSPSLKSLAVSSDSGDVDILRLTGSDDTWGLEERFALPSPPGSSSSPSSVAVSAAGVLASSHGSAATDSCRAGRARLWATGGIMSRVAYTLAPRVGEHSAGSPEGCCLAWGHGGQYLAAATAIGQGDNWQWTISIFEPYAAEDSASSIIRPSIVLPATGRLNSLAWQQGGRGLIAGGSDGMVLLWEGKDSLLTAEQGGGPQWRVEVGEGYVNALAWSPGDNARLAVGSQSGEVSVWAGSPGGLQRLSVPATHRHSGWIRTVAWSSDGVMLASGGQDGHVLVLDTGSASSLNLTVPTRPTAPGSLGVFVRELSWTSGGVLVIGMDDGSISKWDPHSAVGAAATQVPVRSSCTSLTALDASGREGRLLTGWADGSFQVIDLDRAEGLVGAWNLSPVSGQQVDDVAGSPDGRFVSFLREDGTAGLLVTGFEALREQLMGMVVGELNEQDVLDLGLPRGIELSAARAEAVLQDRAP